jgi:hypothetical protein
VFRPEIVGRLEDLAQFHRTVAERLGRPLPAGWTAPRANAGSDQSLGEALDLPAARRRVAEVYARDFEEFGYDPAGPIR